MDFKAYKLKRLTVIPTTMKTKATIRITKLVEAFVVVLLMRLLSS